jgi:peptide subunit release factor 1 (eRF1)
VSYILPFSELGIQKKINIKNNPKKGTSKTRIHHPEYPISCHLRIIRQKRAGIETKESKRKNMNGKITTTSGALTSRAKTPKNNSVGICSWNNQNSEREALPSRVKLFL